ncbi:50S ribosomal protein L4 [Candidatus Pacearchaeota archaeon]|nr:50S ribosomal protein L4 [Candidatus Pacearchaeota archaeon]
MKTKLFDKSGKEKGSVGLPKNFSVKIREDILARVFDAQRGVYAQAYGAKEGAGAQYSASGIIKKKRHDWKASYGKGISRIPRKVMSRHGASFNWIGATVASTRGGRRPHAPRSEKNLLKKINKKELLIAFNSALAGTINSNFLEKKYGRKVESGFIFDGDVLKLKTKDFIVSMKAIFGESFESVLKHKTVRAGIGKMRGRKYKSNAGLLFVIGNEEKMKRKGIEVVNVSDLTIKDLSPNGEPGRLVCYTENAVSEIGGRFK